MKAWATAALLFVGPTFAEATVGKQKDALAAAAGLASPDPAARTRAACELRELGSGATPVLGRLAERNLLHPKGPLHVGEVGREIAQGEVEMRGELLRNINP